MGSRRRSRGRTTAFLQREELQGQREWHGNRSLKAAEGDELLRIQLLHLRFDAELLMPVRIPRALPVDELAVHVQPRARTDVRVHLSSVTRAAKEASVWTELCNDRKWTAFCDYSTTQAFSLRDSV